VPNGCIACRSAVVCGGLTFPPFASVTAVETSLLDCLPPEIAYRRVPLPDAENAYPLWRDAAAMLPTEEDWHRCESDDADECEVGCPEPQLGYRTSEALAHAQGLLERHRPALELCDAGLRRGRLQMPSPSADGMTPELGELRELFRLCLVRVHVAAGENSVPAVAEGLTACLQFADLACDGEGTSLHFIFGTCMRDSAVSDMRFCARLPGCGEAEHARLAGAMQASLDRPIGLQTGLRVGLCLETLPLLEQMPDGADLEPLVEAWLRLYFSNSGILLTDEPLVDESRVAWRKEQILRLLDGHPRPFDKRATARMMGERTAKSICRLTSQWRPQRHWPRWIKNVLFRLRHFRPRPSWPAQLGPGLPFELLGVSAEAAAAREQVFAFMDPSMRAELEPPTPRELERCRRRLRSIDNPIGREIASSASSSNYQSTVILSRTRGMATLACLALQRHKMLHGRLPVSLSDLVGEGLLRDVPLDPYCDRPLRYCPRRRIVWSVGTDGRDNGGREGMPFQKGTDLVFSVGA